MPRLEHTSVPPWAVPAGEGTRAPVRATGGAAYLLVGVGAGAADQLAAWLDEAGEAPCTTIAAADREAALVGVHGALASARVGVRLLVAGPVGDCLAVRAAAARAGMEDDEVAVAATSGEVDLHCVHCGAATATAAELDASVPCSGCGRSLLLYAHVSRRTGRFLGFQVDAEECA